MPVLASPSYSPCTSSPVDFIRLLFTNHLYKFTNEMAIVFLYLSAHSYSFLMLRGYLSCLVCDVTNILSLVQMDLLDFEIFLVPKPRGLGVGTQENPNHRKDSPHTWKVKHMHGKSILPMIDTNTVR